MTITESETTLWSFWNNCYLGRVYPRRRLRPIGNYADTVICDICEKKIPFSKAKRYRYRPNRRALLRNCFLCEDCYKIHRETFREWKESQLKDKLWRLTEERKVRFEEAMKSIEKFDEMMTNCRYGTCDIFAAHHELLKDDPNRLTTEFMIGLTCGEEKKKEYLKLKGSGEK